MRGLAAVPPIQVEIWPSSKNATAGQDEPHADVNKASSGAIEIRKIGCTRVSVHNTTPILLTLSTYKSCSSNLPFVRFSVHISKTMSWLSVLKFKTICSVMVSCPQIRKPFVLLWFSVHTCKNHLFLKSVRLSTVL